MKTFVRTPACVWTGWSSVFLIVVLKAVERMYPVYEAQLLGYLKLTGHRLGLLINFHVPLLKDGIKQIIL